MTYTASITSGGSSSLFLLLIGVNIECKRSRKASRHSWHIQSRAGTTWEVERKYGMYERCRIKHICIYRQKNREPGR